ncbi:PREDICTED: protein ROOT PRIMORDIUM DEFECTIVE 1 [Populus euphratica]|uniref:Protein ROOT PRIMORDIUM DEFECTIVE 1 n=1 Tax=Populus euphratica TaxID=75702 RepID=A0AAJ6XF24_POPEU|nr:PREDICTED: protein ROOT PRIMORDIUM DEFECTIVE 1 [Populus euphratica]
MAWRLFLSKSTSSKTLTSPLLQNPTPNPLLSLFSSHFSTSFLVTKTPKKHKKKRRKPESPRTRLVQHPSTRIPQFESLLERDSYFRFLTKSKQFLSQQPERILRLDDAGKLHQELGFPRGRKIHRFLQRHPLIFQTYRHTDNKLWVGFTDFMEELLEEEKEIMDSMESDRVNKVRKLLMMSKNKRIPLSKIHHCRLLLGIPDDFRDRVAKYPHYFRIVVESDGKRILELVNWDPSLAVSKLEKEFMVNEEKAKRAFKFPIKHGKDLDLEVEDTRRLNLLNTLPLVSPYSDGERLELWSLEAEKYRVGILHEFLSLTLEKRASIHHIVEFREELCLTKHTYDMLKKQPRTFYLAGTEMNWVVFLKDAYDENGGLIDKDSQVIFNEKLYKYAQMKEGELDSSVWKS